MAVKNRRTWHINVSSGTGSPGSPGQSPESRKSVVVVFVYAYITKCNRQRNRYVSYQVCKFTGNVAIEQRKLSTFLRVKLRKVLSKCPNHLQPSDMRLIRWRFCDSLNTKAETEKGIWPVKISVSLIRWRKTASVATHQPRLTWKCSNFDWLRCYISLSFYFLF